MTKCIRDGKVAILYSPGYGAGWSTWNCEYNAKEFLLHDEKLVELVETNQQDKIEEYVHSMFPDVYCGGADDLSIKWVFPGTLFIITEYDGSESVMCNSDNIWNVA